MYKCNVDVSWAWLKPKLHTQHINVRIGKKKYSKLAPLVGDSTSDRQSRACSINRQENKPVVMFSFFFVPLCLHTPNDI